jgi:hypothetical protein
MTLLEKVANLLVKMLQVETTKHTEDMELFKAFISAKKVVKYLESRRK